MAGIDDIALHLPKCTLSIAELAKEKNLDLAKLQKGLGLYEMRLADYDEDVVTMAGEAIIELLAKNPGLDPKQVERIYVGTESGFDGSKPVASYLVGIVGQYLSNCKKPGLQQCDAVDMVFACIGAVDAMQNCLYWLEHNPGKKAIVVATDVAKYELDSPGEYTQGAGAVALLLSDKPRLMEIPLQFASATENAHDFFKPHRLRVKIDHKLSKDGEPVANEVESLFSEFPVFDGPVSNDSYQDRMVSAYNFFKDEYNASAKDWKRLIFHQPYAFHGRRMAMPLFLDALSATEKEELMGSIENDERALRKSEAYQKFITEQIADGEYGSKQVGNMYTASIFLCLISTLHNAAQNNSLLAGDKLGFIAYGSGAKSKVFQGKLVTGWKTIAEKIKLDEKLESKFEVDYQNYVKLHKGTVANRLSAKNGKVFLSDMGLSETNYGARNYRVA